MAIKLFVQIQITLAKTEGQSQRYLITNNLLLLYIIILHYGWIFKFMFDFAKFMAQNSMRETLFGCLVWPTLKLIRVCQLSSINRLIPIAK
jgi:hypothetical protein